MILLDFLAQRGVPVECADHAGGVQTEQGGGPSDLPAGRYQGRTDRLPLDGECLSAEGQRALPERDRIDCA